MARFVSLIEEALIYLSERTTIPYYTKLMPKGAELPRGEIICPEEYESIQLSKLLRGYKELRVNEAWAGLFVQDRKLYWALLREFFPKPIDLLKIRTALNQWNPIVEPESLIMLAEFVALNKEKMLKFDKFYGEVELYKAGLLDTKTKKDFLDKLKAEGLLRDETELNPACLDR
ncbi:MAG: hypothetical protein JHC21_05975, partial [Thermocrinis sp.]|nr:hypothetical protein [Thermocrinis sp.]